MNGPGYYYVPAGVKVSDECYVGPRIGGTMPCSKKCRQCGRGVSSKRKHKRYVCLSCRVHGTRGPGFRRKRRKKAQSSLF